jgi:cellulose synthase/poly-beta-1,6-N-acetylglucosamine synthase-like glycosyltransferase
MESQSLWIGVTLVAFALLFYTYIGYPVALWGVTRLMRSRPASPRAPGEWPTVSILISAYNEEAVIAERVENLLTLDYPSERLEILIGSDGSADRTAEIVGAYRRVRLLSFTQRRGKASVLNDLVAAARGDIVVLTDANTFFRADAVRRLVETLLGRPYGSVAVGQLELRSRAERGNLDGSYWRFETWIKTLESRVGSLLGANGAIYAFRRERYQPLPPQAIVDDFLIPMLMRLRFGDRIFFVPEARAWERSPDEVVDEFRRRVRIGAGDFQALKWTWRLLLPWKGMIALTYFSHKVLRWLGPWFMLAGLVGNLVLIGKPLFTALLVAQLAFYGMALAGRLLRPLPAVGRVASAARYFLVLNAGLFCGFLRLVSGAARPTWAAAPRKAVDVEGG